MRRGMIIRTLGSMLTGAAVAWLAATHHAVASSVNERAAIAALNQTITDAIQRRDIDTVMAGLRRRSRHNLL
jgi:hypothetical protein